MKRALDLIVSLCILITLVPIISILIIAVYLEDLNSPFYLAERVGKNGKKFKMVKIRTMVWDADKTGIDSTASNDSRITRVGKIIRKIKFDEITQFINVLLGDMSIVGPRPQVARDVALYTKEEEALLSVKPGISDLASIVFYDEGNILKNYKNTDRAYNQIIRPWKSRLGIIYIKNYSIWLDICIVLITCLSMISKKRALNAISKMLNKLGADSMTKAISKRNCELHPYPPPGSEAIEMRR